MQWKSNLNVSDEVIETRKFIEVLGRRGVKVYLHLRSSSQVHWFCGKKGRGRPKKPYLEDVICCLQIGKFCGLKGAARIRKNGWNYKALLLEIDEQKKIISFFLHIWWVFTQYQCIIKFTIIFYPPQKFRHLEDVMFKTMLLSSSHFLYYQ